jgi:hypothetical protein
MEFAEQNGQYSVDGKPVSTKEEFLLEFLRGHKKLMPDNIFYDFILAKGIMFHKREPSKNFEIVKKLPFRAKVKECFYTSQMLALEDDKNIKYFEGYGFDDIMPVEHAWCVIDGKVVDLTWEKKDKMFNKNNDGNCIYFGVEIPIEMVREHIVDTGMSDSMLWRVWKTL